jgi:hypothetical protein
MDSEGQKFYYGRAPPPARKEVIHYAQKRSLHSMLHIKITYQLRSPSPGYIYFAHSELYDHIKVGYGHTDPHQSETRLPKSVYGNVNDWDIKRNLKITKDAGKCEFEIHNKLEKWRKPVVYSKNGQDVECREIFTCPLAEVEAAYWAVTKLYK